jgi:hypothetical protein
MLHTQFYARVKMRGDGVEWDAAPTLVSEQHTTALTDHVLALAGGFRQIGVSLYAHPAAAGLVTGAWDDYVTLVRLDVTVDDAIPPSLSWVDGGSLLDGAWHRTDVCGTVSIADGQSGVGAAWLVSDGVSSTWAAPGTGSQYQPGFASGQPGLCLAAGALGDGVHAGAVGGSDASGGQAAPLPFTVHIDRTPPVARLLSPAEVAADARPTVEFDVGDATSGVSSVIAQIDGTAVPLELAGGRASGQPAAPLAYGAHALTWSVADNAGNSTAGSARFDVPDTTAPLLGAPQPANGTVLADGDVLTVAVAVSDEGSGVDSKSVDLALDDVPVDHVWSVGDVVHAVVGRRLAAGAHHLVLRVADRAGNVARLAWDVTVAPGAGPAAGSAPAGAGGSTGGAGGSTGGAGGASPGSPGSKARKRAASVRALAARVGAARPRVVIVRLRARARLRIVLQVRCGHLVRTLRVRAGARGIAIARVACPGVATVRLVGAPGRLLVHIAARRLPLKLQVRPQSRSAPTVARVSGHLREMRGHQLVLEALTAGGWRRVGLVRVDSSGRFATSFAIVHAGQFALRARVSALAGAASVPFVLTMR